MADVTLWLPEADPVTHQALGKAAEEAGELTQILARCLIQGLAAKDPKTGQPNVERLAEELADMDAAISWIFELLDLDTETHNDRADRKLNGFREWQGMIQRATTGVGVPVGERDSATLEDGAENIDSVRTP